MATTTPKNRSTGPQITAYGQENVLAFTSPSPTGLNNQQKQELQDLIREMQNRFPVTFNTTTLRLATTEGRFVIPQDNRDPEDIPNPDSATEIVGTVEAVGGGIPSSFIDLDSISVDVQEKLLAMLELINRKIQASA